MGPAIYGRLAWLAAVVVAGTVTLLLDSAPTDPTRRAAVAALGQSAVMIYSETQWPAYEAVRFYWRGYLDPPALRIGVYANTSPQQVRDCARFLEAIVRADAHALPEPVFCDVPGGERACVIPTDGVPITCNLSPYKRGPRAPYAQASSGAVWSSGSDQELADLIGLVASYRRAAGRPEPAAQRPEPAAQRPTDVPSMEFHPTRQLCPLAGEEFERFVLAWFVEHHLGFRLDSTAEGLILTDAIHKQDQLRQVLAHQDFVRLVRDVTWGSAARRGAAVRAALASENLLVAQFALYAWSVGLVPGEVLEAFPDRLVPEQYGGPIASAIHCAFDELPPSVVSAAVQRLAADADSPKGTVMLRMALACQSAAVRETAMGLILAQLPEDTLWHFSQGPGDVWSLQERESFCDQLVDRLHEELRDERRARKAVGIVGDSLNHWKVLPDEGRARSRLLELAAALFLDEHFGPAFRRTYAGSLAAEELLHDIRPEVRWMACSTIVEFKFLTAGPLLRARAGDPYTDAFAPSGRSLP